MPRRLLDRQVSLLKYLTDGSAIFGERADAALDGALRGIDLRLLHLEARFSHEKRMEKIAAVFPRTFELLGVKRDSIIREFVQACPPADISRIENARQFNEFLHGRWQRQAPNPPYLPDVVACEFALAQVRVAADCSPTELPKTGAGSRGSGARRSPGVALLRCAYDVRELFEHGSGSIPIARDTWLAIAVPRHAGEPQIFELDPVAYDLLDALDDWTDAAAFGGAPDANDLLTDLAAAGLLQVRH
jgi:hypothetical protein